MGSNNSDVVKRTIKSSSSNFSSSNPKQLSCHQVQNQAIILTDPTEAFVISGKTTATTGFQDEARTAKKHFSKALAHLKDNIFQD